MKKDGTTRFVLDPEKPPELTADQKARLDALSDTDVNRAALSDPDAQPLTEEALRKFKRVPNVTAIRKTLHLSQREFSDRFRIPIGTVRDWEQHRSEPDHAACSYLRVIEAEPDVVADALEEKSA